jgi:hypothetical protein
MLKLLALLAVVVGLALRVSAAFYDLPYVFHPDEPHNLNVMYRLFTSGDANPRWFGYPTLFYYLNTAAYFPFYWWGQVQGYFASPTDLPKLTSIIMGVSYAPDTSLVMLGRGLTLLFSVGMIALAVPLGRRASANKWVGPLYALFIAVSPILVYNSRFITPDTYVTFWTMLTVFWSVQLQHRGRTTDYLLAAVCVGLAASTKYNGAVVMVAPMMAHGLRTGWAGLKDWRLYLMPPLALVAFLMASPFIVLDSPTFWAGLGSSAGAYSTGMSGMEGDSLPWYLKLLWQAEGLVVILAAVQVVRGVVQRSKATLLLASFSLTYLLFISSFSTHNDRTLMPVMPVMLLAATLLVADGIEALQLRMPTSQRALASAVAAVLVLLCLSMPLSSTLQTTRRIMQVDSRTTARLWIEEHLPPASRVALEAYAPFVPPDRYAVQPVELIIDYPLEWYQAQQVEYLIFSEGRFGRYYLDTGRYGRQVAAYDRFFNSLPLVKQFDDGGYDVRIYRVSYSP